MLAQRFPNAGSAIEFLKRRMVEQKANEPRRKFVEDHQLIHDRNKNEPSIPFLPGHDQEMWFAKLESNGIWNWVFEYLTNPSDVTSAYFSCEMFRKHLEEKRKAMLLPKAFEVLQDKGDLQYSRSNNFLGIVFEKEMEERREVMKLRLVSKSWKQLAEEVFLVPLKYSVSQPIWHPDNWDWSSPMITSFTRIGEIENGMEKLGNTKSCASLLRLVKVDALSCEDNEAFYSKLFQFLDVHGESIWGLRFASRWIDYEKLCQVVSKTPHLKMLKLRSDLGHCMWGYFKRETHEDFRLMTSQTPFPTLPELEFCHLMNYSGATECLTAEILRKSTNLKAVVLNHYEANSRDSVISPIIWDALRNLHLEYFDLNYDSYGNHFMKEFSKLRRYNWPLKFLHIYLYTYHDYFEFEIDSSCKRILRVMSCFNDTLEEFRFGVSDGTLNLKNKERNVVVDFPKLKAFDLSDDIIIRNA